MHSRRAEGGFCPLVQELRLRTFNVFDFVFSIRAEGGVELFFASLDGNRRTSTCDVSFEMEHRRQCLQHHQKTIKLRKCVLHSGSHERNTRRRTNFTT